MCTSKPSTFVFWLKEAWAGVLLLTTLTILVAFMILNEVCFCKRMKRIAKNLQVGVSCVLRKQSPGLLCPMTKRHALRKTWHTGIPRRPSCLALPRVCPSFCSFVLLVLSNCREKYFEKSFFLTYPFCYFLFPTTESFKQTEERRGDSSI